MEGLPSTKIPNKISQISTISRTNFSIWKPISRIYNILQGRGYGRWKRISPAKDTRGLPKITKVSLNAMQVHSQINLHEDAKIAKSTGVAIHSYASNQEESMWSCLVDRFIGTELQRERLGVVNETLWKKLHEENIEGTYHQIRENRETFRSYNFKSMIYLCWYRCKKAKMGYFSID